jgi:hypothetical protein
MLMFYDLPLDTFALLIVERHITLNAKRIFASRRPGLHSRQSTQVQQMLLMYFADTHAVLTSPAQALLNTRLIVFV